MWGSLIIYAYEIAMGELDYSFVDIICVSSDMIDGMRIASSNEVNDNRDLDGVAGSGESDRVDGNGGVNCWCSWNKKSSLFSNFLYHLILCWSTTKEKLTRNEH